MREIEYTTRFRRFRRDCRREQAGTHSQNFDRLVTETVTLLAADKSLPRRYFDHSLTGDWVDHRDCHIKPDLVLVYPKIDGGPLLLVRLGSHSELDLWFSDP